MRPALRDQTCLTLPSASDVTASREPIALTTDIERVLAEGAAVAVGVSGGKDSACVALAVDRHLRQIGHDGPRILIHADLGRVEWRDSLPSCERLAAHIGWDLTVIRRPAGDLLTRWQTRWENNVARYTALDCVRLILPWSTPSMRFCTSEMKTKIIARALRVRFPDRHILNVVGIRREESRARAQKPVASADASFARPGHEAFTWNAIIEWGVGQVLGTIADAGLRLHNAYTVHGSSRVSCAFCIMSSIADLRASAGCADNHDLYRTMVALEAESSFGFQGNRWLADVAPQLLPDALRSAVKQAQLIAHDRVRLESRMVVSALVVEIHLS